MNRIESCHAVVLDAHGALFDVAAPARTILENRAGASGGMTITAEVPDCALAASGIDVALSARPAARIASLGVLPALLGGSS